MHRRRIEQGSLSRRDIVRIVAYGATISGCRAAQRAAPGYPIHPGASQRQIQTAIDAVKRKGGSLYFPPGQYFLRAPLDLTGARGLHLCGAGKASEFVFDSYAGFFGRDVIGLCIEDIAIGGCVAHAISIVGDVKGAARDVMVRGSLITGATRPGEPVTAGVLFDGVAGGRIDGCVFGEIGGPSSDAVSSLCVYLRGTTDCQVLRNHCGAPLANMAIGVEDSRRAAVRSNTIQGARARADLGAWGYGIYFYRSEHGAVPTEHNVCSWNTITGTDGAGIYLQGSTHSLILRNDVEDTCRTVRGTALALGGIALNEFASDCVLLGNTVVQTGNTVLPAPGIRFDAARTRVIANRVTRPAGTGVQFNGSPSESEITNNVVSDSGLAGIAPYSRLLETTELTISANTVHGTNQLAPGIAAEGPADGAGLVDVRVVDNHVDGTSGAGISVARAHGVTIARNIVRANGGADSYPAIYVAECIDTMVLANDATRAGHAAIEIVGGQRLVVSANETHSAGTPSLVVSASEDVTSSGNR